MTLLQEHIAARLKNLRIAHRYTYKQISEMSGVDRSVVATAEKTGDVRATSLKKIARAFNVTLSWLNRPFLGEKPYRVDKAQSTNWFITNPSFVAKKGVANSDLFADANERARLGENKLANAFIRTLNIDLPGTALRAFVVETYQPEQGLISEQGVILIYVLKGEIEVQLNDETLHLTQDDAIQYWADVPNHYKTVTPSATVLEVFLPLTAAEIDRRELFKGKLAETSL